MNDARPDSTDRHALWESGCGSDDRWAVLRLRHGLPGSVDRGSRYTAAASPAGG